MEASFRPLNFLFGFLLSFQFLVCPPIFSQVVEEVDNCMSITTFTNKMIKVKDWNTHYRFYIELEGCRDGMYLIKLQTLGLDLMQSQWNDLWSNTQRVKNSDYLALLDGAVISAKEDEKDGGEKVRLPTSCPQKNKNICEELRKKFSLPVAP